MGIGSNWKVNLTKKSKGKPTFKFQTAISHTTVGKLLRTEIALQFGF
jgi:hypothetical protein